MSQQPDCTAEKLDEMKQKVVEAECLGQLVGVIFNDEVASKSVAWEFAQAVTGEIAALARDGPLTEFPPNVNTNIYARVCEYGMEKLPLLTTVLARVSIRSSTAVLPSDVISISNTIANICFLANRNLDGVVKTRSFALQASGTTDEGLGLLSSAGLTTTPRHLNQFRDKFAEVGPLLLQSLSKKHPTQVLLDNLNFRTSAGAAQENMMLKCSVIEAVDTRMLSTVGKEKAEVLEGFTIDKVLLQSPVNAEEREQLVRLIAKGFARTLATARPRAEKLGKFLRLQKKKVPQHIVNTDKIYACNETSHSDMVRLGYQVQSEYLEVVANYKEGDPVFLADLKLLEDVDADDEVREAAEARVRAAVEEYGCWVGYGDQLTWQVMQDIKVVVAQEVTAFGRLEFLGPFRLAGMHSLMKKVSTDFKAVMKKLTNFSDPCCMSQMASRCGLDRQISNEKKKIVTNDSSFELHHQFFAAVGSSFGNARF